MTKPTRLCTDASRNGVGLVLQQQSSTGQWALIQVRSHFLTPAESRYAVIELELLAVTRGVMKCKLFLFGLQHFQVTTDYNPLVPIFNSHHLDEIDNPGLWCLHMILIAYNFTAKWCKGSTNAVPDALFCYPVLEPKQEDMMGECDEDHNLAPSIAEQRVW